MAQFVRDYTLVAATELLVDVPVNGAPNWSILVANTGGNPVTEGSVARSPLGPPKGRVGPPIAMPAGIPLAVDASLVVTASGENITALRLAFVSALGTTIRLEARL